MGMTADTRTPRLANAIAALATLGTATRSAGMAFDQFNRAMKPHSQRPEGPTLGGDAKCQKKGHRPKNKLGQCSRCMTVLP